MGKVCLWRKLRHREERYKFEKGATFDAVTGPSIYKTLLKNKPAEVSAPVSSLLRAVQHWDGVLSYLLRSI